MTTHTYVAVNCPSLQLTLNVDEDRPKEKIEFASGNYITEDDTIASILDKVITKKPALKRMIRKLDKAAAEETARRHLESMRNPMEAGAKGGMNSVNANLANRMQMNERDAVLDKVDSKLKEEQFPEKDIMLTVDGGVPATKADARIAIAPVQKIILNQADE